MIVANNLSQVSCSITIFYCAVLCLVGQLCPTLYDPMDCSLPSSFVHGDSPGKNTRVSCHALLQGVFPTQGVNPGLPHCMQILYHLSHREAHIQHCSCLKCQHLLLCKGKTPPNCSHLFPTVYFLTSRIAKITYCCSVAQLCLTVCGPMDCIMPSSLSFTISWSLLKLMSIESVMPFNHLIFCHPLLLLPSIFPASGSFSRVGSLHQWQI